MPHLINWDFPSLLLGNSWWSERMVLLLANGDQYASFHIASLLIEMVRMLYIFPKRGYKPGEIWSPDINTLIFTVLSLFFKLELAISI